MPLIPMNQTITIDRVALDAEGNPISTGWGGFQKTNATELKCRVEQSSELVPNQNGDKVVATLKIYLDKLADVGYEDVITYVDELNRMIKQKPMNIMVSRNIGGKPIMTTVYLGK